jgi:tetratricopeptide (TPR) repeat protein
MAAALERCQKPRSHAASRSAFAVIATAAAISAGVWLARGPQAESVPFAARDWVLVTAVENHTGDRDLDIPIQYALERELAGSSFVNVASRQRIADTLQLMQKPADTLLDDATSREVALRDGAIRMLVTARIDKVGADYALSARLARPADGHVLSAAQQPAVAKDRILAEIAQLGRALRAHLGDLEPATSSAPALPKVITASLRALQLYAQAAAMRTDDGGFGGKENVAEQLLRQAVMEDANFASAHHLLALAIRLDSTRPPEPRHDEALAHARRAVALAEFATPVERIRHDGEVHAIQYFANPVGRDNQTHFGRARASCEALLRLDRDDVDALIACTALSTLIDQPHVGFATRLASLRPNSARWQLSAARALLASRPPQREAARTYAERAETLPMHGDAWTELVKIRLNDAEQAWLRRDARTASLLVEKVLSESESLAEAGRRGIASGAARAYLTLGQLARAESLVPRAHLPAQPNLLATILLGREDQAALRKALHRRKTEEMTGITTALIEAGMLTEARQALDLLRTQPLMTKDYILMAEGQLAVAEKRYEDAIPALEAQLRLTPPGMSVMRQWRAMAKLGTALLATNSADTAIAVLEGAPPPGAVDSQGLGWGFEWLLVRERLAQAYRRAGRVADAEKVESELLELLAVADDDHPIRRRLSSARTSVAAQR